ncbi:MAG: hypothetical protein QF619_08265, partial [Candidatus Binatia bacterium]|nr:hypothetical protein [Candidatus Binatia bacterium]
MQVVITRLTSDFLVSNLLMMARFKTSCSVKIPTGPSFSMTTTAPRFFSAMVFITLKILSRTPTVTTSWVAISLTLFDSIGPPR